MKTSMIGMSIVLAFSMPASSFGLSAENEALKVDLEARAIRYFLDNANPGTGMVLDRAPNFQISPVTNNVSSLAATGFGLMVLSNAAARGIIDSNFVRDYAIKTLRFTRDHVDRYHGWFLHFVDWANGSRAFNSEYSTIDTAIFIAGALYAAQIFPRTEISGIVNQLYADIDFNDMLTDGGKFPNKQTLSLAYVSETGYDKHQWEWYDEHMLLLILGIGHPTRPLPIETWATWARTSWQIGEPTPLMGAILPLFVHQYSHLMIDFRNFNDGYPNYYLNSIRATEYNRRVSLAQKGLTFSSGFWGFSAGDAPNPKRYAISSPVDHGSVVCIGCALGSTMFKPDGILNDARAWLQTSYRDLIWGSYGFIDSLDVDNNWFSSEVLGITVGPIYLSLANIDMKTSIWPTFMNIPTIRDAIARLQVQGLERKATILLPKAELQ